MSQAKPARPITCRPRPRHRARAYDPSREPEPLGTAGWYTTEFCRRTGLDPQKARPEPPSALTGKVMEAPYK